MAQSLSLSPTRRTDDVGHSQTERPTDLTERGYYAVSYHSGNNIPSRAEQNRTEQSRADQRYVRGDVVGLILIRASLAAVIFSSKGFQVGNVCAIWCFVSGWAFRLSRISYTVAQILKRTAARRVVGCMGRKRNGDATLTAKRRDEFK